ncbi:Hsp70 protein-domain-containing protein [Pavlovales sp. CCMP2436]|nr:Hsp70 protein-domain-containing protein [Pavlovales sp. CCMP2436]
MYGTLRAMREGGAENGDASRWLAARSRLCCWPSAGASANTEIPVAIEALHEEVDFRMIMKRVEFEQRCDTLWSRFKAPLDLALKQAGLEPSQVDKVEIVGGATRIPRIKQIALDYFGRAQVIDEVGAFSRLFTSRISLCVSVCVCVCVLFVALVIFFF